MKGGGETVHKSPDLNDFLNLRLLAFTKLACFAQNDIRDEDETLW